MKVEEGRDDAVNCIVPDDLNALPVIFNLQGIRIYRAPSRLPAGIYVINGRKVALK